MCSFNIVTIYIYIFILNQATRPISTHTHTQHNTYKKLKLYEHTYETNIVLTYEIMLFALFDQFKLFASLSEKVVERTD